MPDNETEDDPLLTTGQAATILGNSAPTVRRLIADGKLRTVGKLAGPRGPYLIRESEVRALLTARAA